MTRVAPRPGMGPGAGRELRLTGRSAHPVRDRAGAGAGCPDTHRRPPRYLAMASLTALTPPANDRRAKYTPLATRAARDTSHPTVERPASSRPASSDATR